CDRTSPSACQRTTLPCPASVKRQACPWAEKRFAQLPADLQACFLDTELQMAIITEATGDEVRDLFIRLQDGTPLTTQQKRDAWPRGGIFPAMVSIYWAVRPGRPCRLLCALSALCCRTRRTQCA